MFRGQNIDFNYNNINILSFQDWDGWMLSIDLFFCYLSVFFSTACLDVKCLRRDTYGWSSSPAKPS